MINPEHLDAMKSLEIPLGPELAGFIGIERNLGRDVLNVDQEVLDSFRFHFGQWQKDQEVSSRTHLVLLLEELVAMRFGDLALKLHLNNRQLQADHDFRGLLSLGNAAMLEQELDEAIDWFIDAQKIAPEEMAPYVNMSQVLFHRQQDKEALEWIVAGLEHENNHTRLWEMLSLVYQAKFGDAAGEKVREYATQRDSWAGLSLSAMLIDADDAMLRQQLLAGHYDQGERSEAFLLEYTAVLGVAGQLEKIPLVVTQAESLSNNPLSWQLYMHAAQAELGMDRPKEALRFAEQAIKAAENHEKAKVHIQGLIDEISETLQRNKNLNA